MATRVLVLLSALLVFACDCGDDGGGGGAPPPSKATVLVRVVDANTAEGIEGARVVLIDADTGGAAGPALTTDDEGRASVELEPGGVYLRAFAQGYHPRPLPGAPQVPLAAAVGDNPERVLELIPLQAGEGGSGRIEGRVLADGGGTGGVLVIADNAAVPAGRAPTTLSGEDGAFVIFNVAAGTYQVSAYLQGHSGGTATAVVPDGGAAQDVELRLASGGTGIVEGQVTFLATQNGVVRVTLIHERSGESVPGLSSPTNGGLYRIEGVPPGAYVAWAALENEAPVGYVMDPDAIRKFGLPRVTVGAGATVEQPFDVTGAVPLVAPTNTGEALEPVMVDGTPTFEWQAYPSADAYILEVADELGTVVWGGFSGSTPRVQIPRGTERVQYNSDSTGAALEAGRTYRWRVFARKDDRNEPAGYILISASEDQRGLFQVAP